jgi:hypothetical protein
MRPGTNLVKITTNPTVYSVEPGGTLRSIVSEANAASLWGADWASRVVDVPDGFWDNYTEGDALTEGVYPAGSLVKASDNADVYYYDGTDYRVFGNETSFTANRFSFDNVLTVPDTMTIIAGGVELATAEADLIDTSSGAGGTIAVGGSGLTVALSGSTAAASTLVDNQALANLATFNFTASSDGAVKVTSAKMHRIGVAIDTTLPAVYLYDGATRLTDEATLSSTYATWNNSAGIFTVPAGETKSITVYSNIADSTGGQTVGIEVEAAADVTTDGATVSGSFPVTGNTHSIADGTLATVSFASSVTPNANTALDPQDEFILWQNIVTVGTRKVNMERLTFRQIGSITTADLKNFKLLANGIQVGDIVAAMDSDGYVTFDLTSAPKELEAKNYTLKVMVDIVGGSGRTTSLSLRKTVDARFIDSELDQPILVQTNSSTFSARTAGTQTISSGTLTITKKTDSASGNVTDGQSAVTLGSFEYKAAGEAMKVETVRAQVIVSDGDIDKLRNGKIMADGVQIGSTADLYASDGTSGYYTEYSLGSSLIIQPGTPVQIDVVADIYDNDSGGDSTSAGDTIQAAIATSSSNVQRQVSLTFLSAPGSDKAANTLTVSTGSLTCSKYTGYANQAIVDPQQAYKLGEFRCTAGSTEDLNITSFAVSFDNSVGPTVADDLTDVYIVYGSVTGATKSSVGTTTTNTWTVNTTLGANDTLAVAVYGDLESSLNSAETLRADLTVTSTTVDSGTDANASEATGQTITIGTADLASAAAGTPLDQYAFGSQTITAANYELTATNDSYTVEEVCVRFLDTNVNDVVSTVYIYDGSDELGSASVDSNGYATTTGLSIPIASGETKTITVKIGLNAVGTNNATPGRNASTTLDHIVAQPGAGGAKKQVATNVQGNDIFVYKNYPIATKQSLTSSTLTNNALQDIYKFKIEPATTGTIGLKQVRLALTWTDEGPIMGDNLELYNWTLLRASTDISDLVAITTDDGLNVKTDTAGVGASSSQSSTVYIAWTTEEQISSATTYTVQAKPRNFDSGTTSSDNVILTMSGDTSAHNGVANVYLGEGDGYAAAGGGGSIWGLATSTTGAGHTTYNFIWSDRSTSPHTNTSGGASGDWSNGYQVKNLPLGGQVMTK